MAKPTTQQLDDIITKLATVDIALQSEQRRRRLQDALTARLIGVALRLRKEMSDTSYTIATLTAEALAKSRESAERTRRSSLNSVSTRRTTNERH